MIYRAHSSDVIDLMINHPSVRPTIQDGTSDLCADNVVADTDNIVLLGEAGGLVFVAQEPGAYEVHVFALSGHRGAKALALARQAISTVFDCYRASLLRANAPLQLPQVAWFARRLGFTSLGPSPCGRFETFIMEAVQWAE